MASELLLKLHHRLLPKREDIGLSPYINLIFMSLFAGNLYYAPVYGAQLLVVALGLSLFFVLYFRSFWAADKELKRLVFTVCALAMTLSEINLGASVIFVYAAGMCGLMSNHHSAKRLLLIVIGIIAVYSVATAKSSFFWIPALFMSVSIGLLNLNQIALKRSREEISALAKMAERERISRDLHDLLGHSLSVITIKSELAAKMMEMGHAEDKIKQEIRAVEQLSRDTLAQVRNAVKGYNRATLNEELQQANVATSAANIRLISEIDNVSLPADVESELALILRESITNVIRHADTEKAWVSFKHDGEQLELKVADQGQFTPNEEQSGMNNMATRISQLGGRMTIKHTPNTQLIFTLPDSAWRIERKDK